MSSGNSYLGLPLEINDDEEVKKYVDEVKSYQKLTPEEEHEQFLKVKSGDMEARDKIFHANLDIVLKVIKNFKTQNKTIYNMDLIQEGNIQLLKAVETYDVNSSKSFKIYAYQVIYSALAKKLYSEGLMINIPYALILELKKYEETLEKLTIEYGRKPEKEEIACEMDGDNCYFWPIDTKKIQAYETLSQPVISLDTLTGIENQVYSLVDDENVGLENAYNDKKKEVVRDVLFKVPLTNDELTVIILKYGFYNGVCYTGNDIAKILKMTVQNVSLIGKRALKKILRYGGKDIFIYYLNTEQESLKK